MSILIEYTQLESGTMEKILEQYYNRFSNCIINKTGSAKYGSIYTAARQQLKCSKSGNHV
jgi:hypothetical protein